MTFLLSSRIPTEEKDCSPQDVLVCFQSYTEPRSTLTSPDDTVIVSPESDLRIRVPSTATSRAVPKICFPFLTIETLRPSISECFFHSSTMALAPEFSNTP